VHRGGTLKYVYSQKFGKMVAQLININEQKNSSDEFIVVNCFEFLVHAFGVSLLCFECRYQCIDCEERLVSEKCYVDVVLHMLWNIDGWRKKLGVWVGG